MTDTFSGGVRTTPTTTETQIPSGDGTGVVDTKQVEYELKVRPYRDWFGSEPGESDQQIDFITRKLNPKGKLLTDEVLSTLERINDKVGEANLGETRLGKIYRYLRMVDSVQEALIKGL